MITPAEIHKLAQLARIKISDDEARALVKEFDSILGYIDQLKKVDVPVVTEGGSGKVKNIMRADIAEDVISADRDLLLAEAPKREGDFIAVKKIIAQD